MRTFLSLLKEEAEESKLKHIHHVEDHPLINGDEGFKHAYGALQQTHEHIKSGGHSSHLTMKYDGSPAIVFGTDPETGKFFVASKSAFNKTPKINHTHEDIKKNHENSPGLIDKLHSALNNLKKVTPKSGVYQGDMMFDSEDKKEDPKDGSVSFTPNTITYKAKGIEGEKIKAAKVGVVVHTQYHGKTIPTMKADPFPDVHNFKHHPDVWHKSAEHDTKQIFHSEKSQEKFDKLMASAKKINDDHKEEIYKAVKPHSGANSALVGYINQTVRTDEQPSTEGFMKHVKGQYKKDTAKLVTAAGKGRKEREQKEHIDYIKDNKNEYENVFKMHGYLQKAKNVLVDSLNQHQGGLEHSIDGKPTDAEGYVTNFGGPPSKLVNRHEFSKKNLLKIRNK